LVRDHFYTIRIPQRSERKKGEEEGGDLGWRFVGKRNTQHESFQKRGRGTNLEGINLNRREAARIFKNPEGKTE